MADNQLVDNNDAGDFNARSKDRSGPQTQVVIPDWGGESSEDLSSLTTILQAITFAVGQPLGVTFAHTRPSFTSGSSGTAIAADSSRKKLILSNNTGFPFWIRPDGSTAVVDEGVPLYPGEKVTLDTVSAVTAIQESGGALNLDVSAGT